MPKTVLVTGAASGIGLASAKLLLQEGYQVMAFDPQEELMRDNLPKGDRISFFCGDISMAEDCSDAVALTVKTFGKLDALLHWGAAHSSKRWNELDAEEFNHIMSVNVTGSFLIAQAAAGYMMAGDGGAIVLTTSTSVIFGATGGNGQGGPAGAGRGVGRKRGRRPGAGCRAEGLPEGEGQEEPKALGDRPADRCEDAHPQAHGGVHRPQEH